MNLTSVDGEKYKLLENDILFRTGTDKFPLLFQYKNYYDYKNKDNNFEITVEQKIFDYNLQYVMNRYSENSIQKMELRIMIQFLLEKILVIIL